MLTHNPMMTNVGASSTLTLSNTKPMMGTPPNESHVNVWASIDVVENSAATSSVPSEAIAAPPMHSALSALRGDTMIRRAHTKGMRTVAAARVSIVMFHSPFR